MICRNCKAEFTGKRKDARFCSTRCRVAYNRHMNAVTAPDVPIVTFSDDDKHRMIAHLQHYTREALIQEILAYREDQQDLRAQLYSLQAHMMKQYELIKVTTDIGTPNERTMKIVAPTRHD